MNIEDLIELLKASTKADRDLDVAVFLACFPKHRIWGGCILVPEDEPDYWAFSHEQYNALNPRPRTLDGWNAAYRAYGTPVWRDPQNPIAHFDDKKWAMMSKSWVRFAAPQVTSSVDAAIDLLHKRWPDADYYVARGRMTDDEPLYGARLITKQGELIGEEEAEANLATALSAAIIDGIRRGK